jgi:hypothetical protein
MRLSTTWTVDDWRTVFTDNARKFRVAVEAAEPADEVPTVPGWTFRELTLHVGRFAHQVAHYLQTGSQVMLRPPPMPDGDPLDYLDTQLAEAADALAETPGNRPVWTFSPAAPDLARVWHRRAAHELNLRRWDAQVALVAVDPTPRELALDGIDEALGTLLPAKYGTEIPVTVSGTVVIAANDGPEAWSVTLTPGEIPDAKEVPGGEPADARMESSATNLLYLLRNRAQFLGTGPEDLRRAVIVE